jgi:hypothetical protein
MQREELLVASWNTSSSSRPVDYLLRCLLFSSSHRNRAKPIFCSLTETVFIGSGISLMMSRSEGICGQALRAEEFTNNPCWFHVAAQHVGGWSDVANQ